MTVVHRRERRGFTVCVSYEHPYREYPIYHGPAIDPRFANPYFPGTVSPYAKAADWSVGHPVPIKPKPRRI